MRPGRAADHSPPSSAAVMEEQCYTSTHPLGHTGPVKGTRYLYQGDTLICILCNLVKVNINPVGAVRVFRIIGYFSMMPLYIYHMDTITSFVKLQHYIILLISAM